MISSVICQIYSGSLVEGSYNEGTEWDECDSNNYYDARRTRKYEKFQHELKQGYEHSSEKKK